MADIPLFPDESNMARFQDFVNIQKEISEHLLAQKHLYEQIGRINRDVEDKVIMRRKKEWERLNLIQAQNIKYNDLVAKRGTLQGAAADRLEGQITSTLQLIKYNRELIDLSKLASEVEMTMAKKQYEEGNKWFKFVGEETQKMLGLDLKQFEAVKATGDKMLLLGNNTEVMAYSVGAVVMMLTGAFNLFKKLDTAAWNFRKAMGMTRKDSVAIRAQSERMAIDFMHLGVSADDAYKAFQTLGQAVGGVHNVTKSMAEDVAIVAAQLGISAEVSTAFMRNLASVSKSSMETQVNSMYIAQSMSAAAGVNLGQVMGDVATKSSETLTMMSRLPNTALRTAIELRRMGTDMDKAANSSRHILDFTENVNEEMEASVLLGRSINLQRARELAYRRDLEGSTKEILRITKSVNFENLDVFQQEAFAKATGKSVDELLKMLQASKQIEQVKRSGTPQQKEQLALYEKMRQENEAAAKARAKDVETQLRQIGNQEQIVRLQNNWNQLLAKVQQVLLPFIDRILGFINDHFKAIKWIAIVIGGIWLVNKSILLAQNAALIVQNGLLLKNAIMSGIMWRNVGAGLTKYLPGIVSLFSWLGGALFTLGMDVIGLGGVIWSSLMGIGETILTAITGSISLAIAGILASFAVGFGIGTLLNKFKFVQDAATAVMVAIMDGWRWVKIGAERTWNWIKKAASSTWDDIVWGIKEIGPQLWQIIVGAFNFAKNKISEWLGFSPSSIGLSILRGISSVGPMVFDALTSPFRRGIAWIADKIPGMSKFADKLRGGVQGMIQPLEKRAQAAYIPAVTVTPKGTEVVKPKDKGAGIGKEEEKGATLDDVVAGNKEIIGLLKSILAKDSNVHMDGQLLSTHLSRQIEFRGGYGVNKVA
jgi:hypothetical protein